MVTRKRILIADDHEVVREGLKITISRKGKDFEIVGEARTGKETITQAEELQPDLVIMDIRMPDGDGVTATRAIKEKYPYIQILILTTYAEEELLLESLRAGASGYLLKDIPGDQLIQAMRTVLSGGTVIDSEQLFSLFKREGDPFRIGQAASPGIGRNGKKTAPRLSEREMEILQLMVEGKTNSEISAMLHLSEGTVRNYVSHIYEQLGVSHRAQAVLCALSLGLVRR
ncbi:MAG: response regulator transcription factor [Firmicutes bacterium]|nr:response regulator transcription factor [Bacillota bacterium]